MGRYLEHTLGCYRVDVAPAEKGKPAMVRNANGVFIGAVDTDFDDGEVSYALTVPILAADLLPGR